jgi:hemoglobin-like flavoprotein
LIGGLLNVSLSTFRLLYWHYWTRPAEIALAQEKQRFERLTSHYDIPSEELFSGLADLAENAKNEVTSASAAIYLGNLYTQQCLNAMLKTTPDSSTAARDKAEKFYRLVVTKHPQQKRLVAKAHYGLAVLAENVADDLATAISEYRMVTQVVDAYSPEAAAATSRIRALQSATLPKKHP